MCLDLTEVQVVGPQVDSPNFKRKRNLALQIQSKKQKLDERYKQLIQQSIQQEIVSGSLDKSSFTLQVAPLTFYASQKDHKEWQKDAQSAYNQIEKLIAQWLQDSISVFIYPSLEQIQNKAEAYFALLDKSQMASQHFMADKAWCIGLISKYNLYNVIKNSQNIFDISSVQQWIALYGSQVSQLIGPRSRKNAPQIQQKQGRVFFISEIDWDDTNYEKGYVSVFKQNWNRYKTYMIGSGQGKLLAPFHLIGLTKEQLNSYQYEEYSNISLEQQNSDIAPKQDQKYNNQVQYQDPHTCQFLTQQDQNNFTQQNQHFNFLNKQQLLSETSTDSLDNHQDTRILQYKQQDLENYYNSSDSILSSYVPPPRQLFEFLQKQPSDSTFQFNNDFSSYTNSPQDISKFQYLNQIQNQCGFPPVQSEYQESVQTLLQAIYHSQSGQIQLPKEQEQQIHMLLSYYLNQDPSLMQYLKNTQGDIRQKSQSCNHQQQLEQEYQTENQQTDSQCYLQTQVEQLSGNNFQDLLDYIREESRENIDAQNRALIIFNGSKSVISIDKLQLAKMQGFDFIFTPPATSNIFLPFHEIIIAMQAQLEAALRLEYQKWSQCQKKHTKQKQSTSQCYFTLYQSQQIKMIEKIMQNFEVEGSYPLKQKLYNLGLIPFNAQKLYENFIQQVTHENLKMAIPQNQYAKLDGRLRILAEVCNYESIHRIYGSSSNLLQILN